MISKWDTLEKLCPKRKPGKLKSLNVFSKKYPVPWRTRCSLRPFEIRTDTKIRNIPLYQSCLV